MIVTNGSERFARKVSMEEGEMILKKVAAYNKSGSEKTLSAIVKSMTPEAVKAKEAKEKEKAKLKGKKKLVKKEIKENAKSEKTKKRIINNIVETVEKIISPTPEEPQSENAPTTENVESKDEKKVDLGDVVKAVEESKKVEEPKVSQGFTSSFGRERYR